MMLFRKTAFAGVPVLVTGGYGFIGSNLVRRLVELGAEVAVVDALIPNTGANSFNLAHVEGHTTVYVVNMIDEAAMEEPVRDKTLVFKVAGSYRQHVRSVYGPNDELSGPLRAAPPHAVAVSSGTEVLRRAMLAAVWGREMMSSRVS